MENARPAGDTCQIDILIPTYKRSHKLRDIEWNIREITATPYNLCFITEEDDLPTIQACNEMGLFPHINFLARSYSGAINSGFLTTKAPFFFIGADDLEFKEGWDTEAIAMLVDGVCVTSTMDHNNGAVMAGTGSTHSMVARWYIDTYGGTVDGGPGIVLHEGYVHNYTDTEFCEVAKSRGVFRPCFTSHVPHHHWANTGIRDELNDRADAYWKHDEALYIQRSKLWR